jgi:hypothetical protein
LPGPKLSLASLSAVKDGKFCGYVPKQVRYSQDYYPNLETGLKALVGMHRVFILIIILDLAGP